MMSGVVAVFEVSRAAGSHRWVLRNWDGEVLAQKDGYLTRSAAVQDIERLRVASITANVVEI
jgi:uncharacterized protein YegP (UPF0339 family)